MKTLKGQLQLGAIIGIAILIIAAFSGCKKEEQPEPVYVYGCTDPHSNNYNPSATKDDGSCKYPVTIADSGKVEIYLPWSDTVPTAGFDVYINNRLMGSVLKAVNKDWVDACNMPEAVIFTLPATNHKPGVQNAFYRLKIKHKAAPFKELEITLNVNPSTCNLFQINSKGFY